jgi:hypothetical protein
MSGENLNLNLIIGGRRSFEIIQEIDNAWEREVKREEQELFYQSEGTNEEDFYVAEVVENETYERNIVHQPVHIDKPKVILDPRTNKPFFLINIELKSCYFTDAGSWASFLLPHRRVRVIFLEKVEEAQDLLQKLESGEFRIVSRRFGSENYTAKTLKNDLEQGLRKYIEKHESGEEVIDRFRG